MRSRLLDVLSRPARTGGLGSVLTLLDPAVVLLAALVLPTWEPTPVVAAAVAMLLVCRAGGLQRPRLRLSVLDDLPHLVIGTLVATLVLGGVSMDLRLGPDQTADLVPVALFVPAILVGCVLLRTALYALVHVLRRTGRLARPVLVVGTGSVARRVADALLAHREHGLVPVGLVDPGGTDCDRARLRGLPLPLVAQVADLEQAVTDLAVDDVVFAEEGEPHQDSVAALHECLQRGRQVFVVPRYVEAGVPRDRHTEVVRDVVLTRLPRAGAPRPVRVATRVADVVVSAAGLVALAPVLVVIAVAVRLETGPGVLFHQVRVGAAGRTFTRLKFRSLRPAAFGEDATTWSIDNDSRIGPVGRLLRSTGLDDLPRLLDVLRGEASLVGARPPDARSTRPARTAPAPEPVSPRQLRVIARDERPRAAGRPATGRDWA